MLSIRCKQLVNVSFLFLAIVGCGKDEELVLPTSPASGPKTGIDLWVADNYTKPYNIAVSYKWNPFELPVNKDLVPVSEDKVIPALNIVKQIWIDPYANVAGEAFIKQYAPKQFVLVGSAQYNNDGTIVLGQAEGGRKVTLFVLNSFDRTNVPAVKEMLHTIHHEFAHILHQITLYPREFKLVTPSGYTASWYNTDEQSALDIGFITPYARSSFDEDFVEMVALMLIEGKDGFESIIQSASPAGRLLLKKKQSFVISYFKSVWDIDFNQLQEETERAIEESTSN